MKNYFDELNCYKVALTELDDKASTALDTYQDFEKLKEARNKLTSMTKNKEISAVVRLRSVAMLGALNLYLSAELKYTWRKAALVIAQAQGHSEHYARKICTWIYEFLKSGLVKLPLPSG